MHTALLFKAGLRLLFALTGGCGRMRISANASALEVLALLEFWKPVLEDCEAVTTEDDDDPVQILLTSAGWLIFNQAMYPGSSTSYPSSYLFL